MKRLASALLVWLILAISASGCSPSQGASQNSDAGENGASSESPVEINMIAGLFNEPPDMGNAYWSKWEEMTNSKLNIEWVDSGNFSEVYNLRLSAGDIPEISALFSITPPIWEAIFAGAYYDLTDLLGDFSEHPNLRDNVPPDCWLYNTAGGRIYALPRNRSRIDPIPYIRKDWLDVLGIPLPGTIDEYADALAQIVKSDADGNGQIDTLGMIGHDGKLPTSNFIAAFGCLDGAINADGTQYAPVFTDEYRDLVAFYRGMYETGALDHEYTTANQSSSTDMANSNRCATYQVAAFQYFDFETNSRKIQPEPDPEIAVLVLEGPKQKALQIIPGYQGGFYLRADLPEDKVKRILQYFDLTTSTEVSDLGYYGVEGVHYTQTDGTKLLTTQGIEEVNTTSRGVGCLAYTKWGKVDNSAASKEYNDKRRAETAIYDDEGKIDLWGLGILYSPSWIATWPKYEKEWDATVAKAVNGSMSLEEFAQYQERLRSLPEFQQAWKEFAVAYEQMQSAKN
ncbi:MAG: extracellular solute-binding protein [Clostridiales bacterium]|jgi:putative aldouronate transport system substrate-binding protein|nr:extracellular solute-binding protein [Clostridiales bacterium]